jgi:hypothetical protein
MVKNILLRNDVMRLTWAYTVIHGVKDPRGLTLSSALRGSMRAHHGALRPSMQTKGSYTMGGLLLRVLR